MDNNYLFFYEFKVSTNINVMNFLSDSTTIKTRIEYDNDFLNNVPTNFYLYNTHILLDNKFFTQEIQLDRIMSIDCYGSDSFILGGYSIFINLYSGDSIIVSMKISSSEFNNLVYEIESRIYAPP